jgi:hypothetical protein
MRTQAMTGLPGVASKTRNGKAFIYPPTQSNRELIRTNREFVGVNREFIEPITDTLTTPSQMRFSVGTGLLNTMTLRFGAPPYGT